MWAVATIPRNRSRQAGQMEAITRAVQGERRGIGRGLKGRRAVVRSRALAFPTERDEKPNSRLDLSSGSLERPGFVYPPPFDSKSP